ncbi:MAG TPA: hypothetical protein VFB14_24135 [Bryobacteraceae bacterium]|jgi:hypothetical protein|nr:hypothetical protein [Bryobacteraceae bacterium]
MNRERELLYAALILAVIESLLMLAAYVEYRTLPSVESAIHQTRECQDKLDRIYTDWFTKHGHSAERRI